MYLSWIRCTVRRKLQGVPTFIIYLETEDLDQVEAAYLRSWNINFFQIDISSHSKVGNLAPVILANQYIPCC